MNRSIRGLRRAVIAMLGTACIAGTASAVTVTSSSGNFSGWTSNSFQYAGAMAMQSVPMTGGNPGEHLRQAHSFQPVPFGELAVALSFTSDTVFTFDPATQGPIDSIDFAIDVRVSPGGVNQSYDLFLIQDGKYYLAELGTNPIWDNTSGASQWTGRSYLGFEQADFTRIDPVANGPVTSVAAFLDSADQPDFSSSGAPIQFGLFTQNNSSAIDPIDRSSDYDNFLVSIVPEPGYGMALVAVTVLAGLARVRSRSGSRAGS